MKSFAYNNTNASSERGVFSFNAVPPDSTDTCRPVFSFEPISLKSQDNDIKLIKNATTSHDFLKRIEKLSSMTWDEIKKSPRDKYGFEQISFSCIKGCSWMITDLKAKNIEKVMVFRVKNKGVSRMLGARFGKEFRIYCFDDKGKLYDHD